MRGVIAEVTPKVKGFKVAELKDQPDHWVLTELGEDNQGEGKALRKPDGTFWEVVAEHFFPPGGGLYRVDIGSQISDGQLVGQLESFYVQARAEISAAQCTSNARAEKFVQQQSGPGKLIFSDNQVVEVIYRIGEFVSGATGALTRRGRISNTEGHPDWHPIISLQPGPFTLVMADRRKLKVTFEDLEGSVRGTGDFF